MSSTVKERITVSELSKFGFKVGAEYVNYSKLLPESDKTSVVPGAEFEAELFVADSGKRYLNKILSKAQSAAQVLTKAVLEADTVKKILPDTGRAKLFTPKFAKKDEPTDKMSKSEWQAKDRSQLIGGLSHDAATITAAMIAVSGAIDTGDLALKMYKALLEGMLKIRDEVK